jgi:hypothetical protein
MPPSLGYLKRVWIVICTGRDTHNREDFSCSIEDRRMILRAYLKANIQTKPKSMDI